jgi:tetratricopeptide (TPR) repeat protein
MLHVTLVTVVLNVFAPQDPGASTPVDRGTYEAVRKKAGPDPAALVKLALWCEAHGFSAERRKHLTEALAIDPANVAAQGLLGLISYRGEPLSPEGVRVKRSSDENLSKKLEDYHARRAALEVAMTTGKHGIAGKRMAALAHEKLGVWCDQQGLRDEAIAHFTTAVQFDPYRDAPWKHLGYVKHRGRWMTHDQIRALDQEARAQRSADRRWDTSLKKWKGQLVDKRRRQEAEDSLASVSDARAVPAIVRVFGHGSSADQLKAATLLSGIVSPASAKELARLAVMCESPDVRETAIASLKNREPRDYVGELIDMVQPHVEYKVQPVQGPGSQGALMIDTPRFTMLRTYDAPPAFSLASTFRGAVTYDSDGMPIVIRGVELDRMKFMNAKNQQAILDEVRARSQQLLIEANIKAAAAQQRIIADVAAIEQFNTQAAALNARILPALTQAAGAPDSATDQDGLYTWWYDRLGYRYEAPEKVQAAVNAFPQVPPSSLTTCFAAGTPVRTIDGDRPIEKVLPGDLVLSQDVASGQLEFRPVVVVHHNAPNQTLRVTLSDDEILLASVYHRFWRAGTGWAQARDLKSGDVLRTLGNTIRVISIEPGEVEPLYNLDVAHNRSFFVGTTGVLVHDNTLPSARLTPFDTPPNLDALPPGAQSVSASSELKAETRRNQP